MREGEGDGKISKSLQLYISQMIYVNHLDDLRLMPLHDVHTVSPSISALPCEIKGVSGGVCTSCKRALRLKDIHQITASQADTIRLLQQLKLLPILPKVNQQCMSDKDHD